MESPDYTLLGAVRVALIEPTHPGNIGAAARAMANMGLQHMALVNPRDFPSAQATARAAGADAVLENAAVVATLDEAIADCALVVGASARLRAIEWPLLAPAEAMRKVAAAAADGKRAALLFGRESCGLTNRELDRCHYLVRIPANPEFSSLNLAAAVLVLAYELRQAAGELAGDDGGADSVDTTVATADQPAVGAEMQHFYRHLRAVVDLLEFGNGRSEKLHRKLTRLFNRARPTSREIRTLRGLLSAVERRVGGGRDGDDGSAGGSGEN